MLVAIAPRSPFHFTGIFGIKCSTRFLANLSRRACILFKSSSLWLNAIVDCSIKSLIICLPVFNWLIILFQSIVNCPRSFNRSSISARSFAFCAIARLNLFVATSKRFSSIWTVLSCFTDNSFNSTSVRTFSFRASISFVSWKWMFNSGSCNFCY